MCSPHLTTCQTIFGWTSHKHGQGLILVGSKTLVFVPILQGLTPNEQYLTFFKFKLCYKLYQSKNLSICGKSLSDCSFYMLHGFPGMSPEPVSETPPCQILHAFFKCSFFSVTYPQANGCNDNHPSNWAVGWSSSSTNLNILFLQLIKYNNTFFFWSKQDNDMIITWLYSQICILFSWENFQNIPNL